MKRIQVTRLQVYSFLLSIPLFSLALVHIMYGQRIFSDIQVWLVAFPMVCFLGLGAWYGQALYSNYTRNKYPEISQLRKRVFVNSLGFVLFMAPVMLIIFLLFDGLSVLQYKLHIDDLKAGIIMGFCVNITFLALWETLYMLEKYKESLAEKEILKQMGLQQEFDLLKSQVNPHFLFNCFNTLSSLIAEDPQRADVFLNELSKVYRYLLRNNENSLSTVQNEFKFIASYFNLLKTRHGDAVQFQVEIDKRYDNYLLPSLSLQLLVENAVKHNVLSKNKPLIIDIFTTAANQLVVSNNLQRRTIKSPSNKIGLDNIRTKYNILRQRGFQVMEDGKSFTVVLPLIWDNNISMRWSGNKPEKSSNTIIITR